MTARRWLRQAGIAIVLSSVVQGALANYKFRSGLCTNKLPAKSRFSGDTQDITIINPADTKQHRVASAHLQPFFGGNLYGAFQPIVSASGDNEPVGYRGVIGWWKQFSRNFVLKGRIPSEFGNDGGRLAMVSNASQNLVFKVIA